VNKKKKKRKEKKKSMQANAENNIRSLISEKDRFISYSRLGVTKINDECLG